MAFPNKRGRESAAEDKGSISEIKRQRAHAAGTLKPWKWDIREVAEIAIGKSLSGVRTRLESIRGPVGADRETATQLGSYIIKQVFKKDEGWHTKAAGDAFPKEMDNLEKNST